VLCVFHDPAMAAKIRKARQAGGVSRARNIATLAAETPDHLLGNTQDVSVQLAVSINQLRRGQLDPRMANAIGYLSSVLLRSLEQGWGQVRSAQSFGLPFEFCFQRLINHSAASSKS